MPGTGRLTVLQQVIPGADLLRATDRSVGQLSDKASTNWSLHGAPASRPVVDGMNYQLAQLNQGVFVYNQVGSRKSSSRRAASAPTATPAACSST